MNRTTILRTASFLTLGLLAALGVFLILKSTPEGLGLSDDSIGYIAGARSMLAGHGYRAAWLASNRPVTHFPPGFPAVLTFIGLFGLDPLRGSRFVNALLFGLNTGLLGILGWRMTKSLPVGLILAALFVTNSQLLQVHAVAMSEPLFIFLSLLAFWMFDLYFERHQHWLWLVLTADFVGAAYLTRYAGLALMLTLLAALFVLQDSWRKRFISSGIFIAGFLPWALIWAVRNKLVGGTAANRDLIWHPITSENIKIGLSTVAEFFVPLEPWRQTLLKAGVFQIVIVLILGAILIWVLWKGWKKFLTPQQITRPEIIAFTNGLYALGYLSSIVAAMLLFDASTKFQPRILAPLYVSLFILLAALGAWLWNKRREAAIALTVFILAVSIYSQTLTVQQLEKGGTGFASFVWYRSPTMAFLRGLPAGTMIYTNQSGAVYLYTGRGAYVLPDNYDPVTAEARPGFDHGVALMQTEIKAGRAVLALFSGGDISGANTAIMSQGLYLAQKSGGGEVYTAAP